MIMLRLARAGNKKRPAYTLVAADRRARRDGRFVEKLGYFMPGRKVLVMDRERVDYWLSVGAQATQTVARLIREHKETGDRFGERERELRKAEFAAAVKAKGGEKPAEAAAPAPEPEAAPAEAAESEG